MIDDEELQHYSAALDEIYRLRMLVAMYADHTEADLTYKSYPKGRRKIVEERVQGLRQAARGESELVLAGQHSNRLQSSLKTAGAKPTLTRWEWENQDRAR